MSFTVYKSSAGSGKTFTLVKEYLKLILPETGKFRHILAITFTNKAANEMKERILFYLKELSKQPGVRDAKVNNILLPLLIKETGLNEVQIERRSDEALRIILHNYSDFAVGTIDSFSHRIIRTFAHDFGLPVNFNVELDSDELLETAIDLLLDRAGDDKDLTDILVKFLETRMDDDKGWNIDTILLGFSRMLMNEAGMLHLEKLRDLKLADFRRMIPEIYRQVHAFEDRIKALGSEGFELIASHEIPAEAFYQGANGIGGYFLKLANKRFDSITKDSHAARSVLEGKWTSSKASAGDARKIDDVREQVTGIYCKIRKEREQHYSRYIFLKMLAGTIYPLAVLNEIDQTLSAFKKQNNIIHISEFNRRIASIVLNEPVPFIYERLGERFNHVMIDEFQDTSQLQWSNLQPLIGNSLASGYFNLVVGDGKQAIYRWRNGDVDQFSSLPSIPGSDSNALLKDRERILKHHFESYPLKENFRSRYEIIDFNNRFFYFLSQQYHSELEKIYDDPVQVNAESDKGGYVSIEFINNKDAEFSYRERTLNRLLERIMELEGDGYRWQDIAILCRKNRDGHEIARFLLQNGIRVISSEALLLGHSPEVNFITGMMKMLNNRGNSILSAGLVTYLFMKGRLKNMQLHQLLKTINTRHSSENFFRILEDHDFKLDLSYLRSIPVFELAEELVRSFSLNSASDPYLQFFLDAVLRYSRKNSSSVSSFLEWWEIKKDKLSVIIPEGLDAVRIMTIHKAKGLQFPVVIHPFAHDKKETARTYLWVDIDDADLAGLKSAMIRSQKDLLETDYKPQYEDEERKSLTDLVNILYVAMTRAEERLYVMTQPAPESRPGTPSVPVFFDSFFKSTGDWIDGKTEYVSGVFRDHEVKARGEDQGTKALSSFISNKWRKKIFIRARAPEVWDVDDPEKKNKWGTLIHSVLSGIATINDLDAAMERISSSGIADSSDAEKLKNTITSIVSHPDTSHLFAEGINVKRESEILLKDGRILRPDRVILDGDQVVIVDYKTGRPDDRHEQQLKEYEAGLMEMGYRDVRKLILYTAPEIKLVEID